MKKQAIILEDRSYRKGRMQDEELFVLADFLTDDVSNCASPEYYQKWAKKRGSMGSGGNSSDLEKIGDNIVIRWLFDEHFGTPEEVSLTISKTDFLEVLESWKVLYKEKPAKITIVKTDKGIILEPSDTVEPEDLPIRKPFDFDLEKVVVPEEIEKLAHVWPKNAVEIDKEDDEAAELIESIAQDYVSGLKAGVKKQSMVLKDKWYCVCRIQDRELFILSDFLISDAIGSLVFFKTWLAVPDAKRVKGNCSDLEKVEENVVVRWLFDGHFGMSEETSVVVSRKNLLGILNSLEDLLEKGPAKITIVQTAKGIFLEPSDTVDSDDVNTMEDLVSDSEALIFPDQGGCDEEIECALLDRIHGAREACFMNDGCWNGRTRFPSDWSNEKVIKKIAESLNNFSGKFVEGRGVKVLESFTDCGIKIRTILRGGNLVTSYPIWEQV